jgi:hypothetical protein
MGQLHEPQATELQAERAGVDLRDPVVVEEQVSDGVLQAVKGAVAQLADLVGGEVEGGERGETDELRGLDVGEAVVGELESAQLAEVRRGEEEEVEVGELVDAEIEGDQRVDVGEDVGLDAPDEVVVELQVAQVDQVDEEAGREGGKTVAAQVDSLQETWAA